MRKPTKKIRTRNITLAKRDAEIRALRFKFFGTLVLLTVLLTTVLFIAWQRGMAKIGTSKFQRDGWFNNTIPTSSIQDQRAAKWTTEWNFRNVKVK